VSPAASRYTAEPNLRYANDSHVMAIARVPANSRVLDLGVADGSVAAVLKGMGCEVWGVELEREAAEAARAVCDEVVVADLNTFEFAEQLHGQRFDVVLMLDILEHLSDPAAVLGRVKAVVAEGGWGIISLPNVAHASVRLALLNGHFRYTEMGLLDRTHLRFFDRAGVDDLLEQAGWGMFDMVRVTRRLGTTEIPVDDVDPVLAADLESDIEGTTYQFVVGAAPLDSPVLEHPPVLPAAVAQGVLLEQEEELRQLRLAHILDLTEQLAAIRAGALERRGQLQGLLDALDENRQRFAGVSG
jgi:2-polyprenyl-3-methyl-5-hydroxy-6-metoxy-1,4-benzoquinol methylase